MTPNRSDRLTRLLTAIASFVFYASLVAGAALLVALPLVKLFAPHNPDFKWGLPVPATVRDSAAMVSTIWGQARLELGAVRGSLKLPVSMLPWWFMAVVWTYVAAQFALMLMAMYNVRRILQRVRDGAPFDRHNAQRLRSVGLMILALALSSGVAEFITSQAVSSGLASSTFHVSRGLHFNAPLMLVALILVVLAEVFRRGSELEAEQSLVI
jgi:hypothetical protein